MMSPASPFAGQSYFSLETYRKSGVAVATPVWFAEDAPGVYYVYSEADAGKVKRVRHNPAVRIAPCTMRGQVTGAWVAARARVVDDATGIARGHQLLRRKYLLKRVFDFLHRFGGKPRAVIEIRTAAEA
jgi:hypothetical protein